MPKCIKIAYLNCNVRPYVPDPRRSFKCQRFGHKKFSCRGKQTCARWGKEHESVNCTAEPHCINCKNNHTVNIRKCPKWIFEKKIQTVKTTNNIPYAEAGKIVEARTPVPGKSFASVVKKSLISVSAQTDEDNSNQPLLLKNNFLKSPTSQPAPSRNKENKHTGGHLLTNPSKLPAVFSSLKRTECGKTTSQDKKQKQYNSPKPNKTKLNVKQKSSRSSITHSRAAFLQQKTQ